MYSGPVGPRPLFMHEAFEQNPDDVSQFTSDREDMGEFHWLVQLYRYNL